MGGNIKEFFVAFNGGNIKGTFWYQKRATERDFVCFCATERDFCRGNIKDFLWRQGLFGIFSRRQMKLWRPQRRRAHKFLYIAFLYVTFRSFSLVSLGTILESLKCYFKVLRVGSDAKWVGGCFSP